MFETACVPPPDSSVREKPTLLGKEIWLEIFGLKLWCELVVREFDTKARFIRRISAVSNTIETIDNEMICFIIYCLNCIRHGRNATYERGLRFTLVERFFLSFGPHFLFNSRELSLKCFPSTLRVRRRNFKPQQSTKGLDREVIVFIEKPPLLKYYLSTRKQIAGVFSSIPQFWRTPPKSSVFVTD